MKHVPSSSANPASSIRKKIGDNIKLQDIFTEKLLQECQSIIEDAHENFLRDILDVWQSIIHNFASISTYPNQSVTLIREIAKDAFIIKSKLDAVGYSLGMSIAKSLHEFASNDANPQNHIVVYSKHIDAMNTIIKNNIKGDGGTVGHEMEQALGILVKKMT